MIAIFIYSMAFFNASTVGALTFDDIGWNHQHRLAIMDLSERGIVQGDGKGHFQPDRFVTRAEFLKMVLLASDAELPVDLKRQHFSDVSLSAWYAPYIDYAFLKTIVQGVGNNLFSPNNIVTRSEALKMTMRLFDFDFDVEVDAAPASDVPRSVWQAKYLVSALNRNLVAIEGDGRYLPNQPLKRDESAQIIHRALTIQEKQIPKYEEPVFANDFDSILDYESKSSEPNLSFINSSIQTLQPGLTQDEYAVISAISKVGPAVVSIKGIIDFGEGGSGFQDVQLGKFIFRIPSSGMNGEQIVSQGTGILVARDGLILTNKHVVDNVDAKYEAVLADGRSLPAQILVTDPFNDLALIKVNAVSLPKASLGDSSQVMVGQTVMAIGNALGKFENSVSRGIISALGRTVIAETFTDVERLVNVIQTDASINIGNSGGPLINTRGEVIGINTVKSLGGENIGFALPINDAKYVIDSYIAYGRVVRPYLGVKSYTAITPELKGKYKLEADYGIIITGEDSIVSGSPADNVGLKPGDYILAVDGKRITNSSPITDLIRAKKVGDSVTLDVIRDSERVNLVTTLAELPN